MLASLASGWEVQSRLARGVFQLATAADRLATNGRIPNRLEETVLGFRLSVGKHQIEAGGSGKRPEIPISGKERNVAINADLGDQGVS
jgi:hypothetical protein